jgi:hypothetical protein
VRQYRDPGKFNPDAVHLMQTASVSGCAAGAKQSPGLRVSGWILAAKRKSHAIRPKQSVKLQIVLLAASEIEAGIVKVKRLMPIKQALTHQPCNNRRGETMSEFSLSIKVFSHQGSGESFIRLNMPPR